MCLCESVNSAVLLLSVGVVCVRSCGGGRPSESSGCSDPALRLEQRWTRRLQLRVSF